MATGLALGLASSLACSLGSTVDTYFSASIDRSLLPPESRPTWLRKRRSVLLFISVRFPTAFICPNFQHSFLPPSLGLLLWFILRFGIGSVRLSVGVSVGKRYHYHAVIFLFIGRFSSDYEEAPRPATQPPPAIGMGGARSASSLPSLLRSFLRHFFFFFILCSGPKACPAEKCSHEVRWSELVSDSMVGWPAADWPRNRPTLRQ